MSQSATFTNNLVIRQGATLSEPWYYAIDGVAVDLTGCTARMQLRASYDAVDPPLVALTSGGGITIDGPNGMIQYVITAAQTKVLSGEGVYDLEVTWADGTVQRLLEGKFHVVPEVTR